MHSIGQVAARTGVNIETIRYYERENILPKPERTPAGRRTYDAAGLARIRFVKRSRDLGFSIAETKALLNLTTQGRQTCGQVKPIAEKHKDTVEKKIHQLTMMREALDELILKCSDSQAECPILDVLMAGE
jgi:MerR family mercuric resistance operon transcriptional regulator